MPAAESLSYLLVFCLSYLYNMHNLLDKLQALLNVAALWVLCQDM